MPTRRHLVLGGAFALAAPSILRAQQPIQLRISTAANEQDWLAKALQRFKAGVEQDLPGQVSVAVHANAALFRQGTEVPALQRGNLEMSTMTTFEIDQQLPEYGVLSAGYVLRDYEHLRKVLAGPIGQACAADVAARMGIQIVDSLYLGTRQVCLRQAREVRTPSDFSGLKLRMPPGPGWLALGKGLGVTPTSMAIPEVYLALKSGAIDGQDNPVAITRANNFHEVSQQMVMTSHLIQPVFFAFAKPFWDRLSPPQQEAMRRNARLAAEFNDTSRLGEEKELLAFFQNAGLKVTSPDLAPFRASVARQYDDDGLSQKWQPGLHQRIAETR
jgi:tripartite ATP-independent transporter DctP family solute receptor